MSESTHGKCRRVKTGYTQPMAAEVSTNWPSGFKGWLLKNLIAENERGKNSKLNLKVFSKEQYN